MKIYMMIRVQDYEILSVPIEHSNVNFVRLDCKITNNYIVYYSLQSKRKRSMV